MDHGRRGSLQWLPARVMTCSTFPDPIPSGAVAAPTHSPAPPPARYLPLRTARHVPYLLVRVRVRPERHRPQSCAIALRSLAPEGSYLILSLIPALISILRGPDFFSRYHLPLYLDRPSNYNIVFGCPSKYNDGRWPHARHPKEQARVWQGISRFHHTPAHPIYWEDHFASCVRGDLNSAARRPQ